MFYPPAVGITCSFSNVFAVALAALDAVGDIFSSAVASSFFVDADHTLVWVIALRFGERVGSVKDLFEGFATLLYYSDFDIRCSYDGVVRLFKF